MLDMGFIQPIRRIVAELPPVRQNLLFSATMPGPIATLANQILRDPVKVAVKPVASTAAAITQWVLLRRAQRQAFAAARDAARRRHEARAGLHPHQARRQPRRRATWTTPAFRRRPSTATSRRARASGRWPASAAARCACWWRPTSPPAASTSTASPTSSTSTCRTSPRATCTASAAPARAGATGVALSFCDREERGLPSRHRAPHRREARGRREAPVRRLSRVPGSG